MQHIKYRDCIAMKQNRHWIWLSLAVCVLWHSTHIVKKMSFEVIVLDSKKLSALWWNFFLRLTKVLSLVFWGWEMCVSQKWFIVHLSAISYFFDASLLQLCCQCCWPTARFQSERWRLSVKARWMDLKKKNFKESARLYTPGVCCYVHAQACQRRQNFQWGHGFQF